jgi:hypothetical protein
MLADPAGDRAVQVRWVPLAESSWWQWKSQISQPRRVYKLKQRLGSLAVQFVDVRRMPRGARVFGGSGSHWERLLHRLHNRPPFLHLGIIHHPSPVGVQIVPDVLEVRKEDLVLQEY